MVLTADAQCSPMPFLPRNPLLRRILALALGLLASLALLEGALWTAYVVANPTPVFTQGPLGTGSRTILCIGDSNTYGVHLPREQSYPGQLQAFLDRWPENDWRVVNVGYPGHNSAEVRGRLAGHLREYRPEITICWVGVNNTWSLAGRHLWDVADHEPTPRALEGLLQRVRVVKMVRLLARDRAARAEGAVARTLIQPQDIRRRLHMDFRRIRAICEEQGSRVLMVDYPVHHQATEERVNEVLWEVARQTDIPIVPLHREVLPAFYGVGYDRVMFSDFHANEVGNHAVARRMLHALIEHGMLPARPEWTSIPPLHETLRDVPIVLAEHDAERPRVLLHGPPHERFQIHLKGLFAGHQNKTFNGRHPYEPYATWTPEELLQRGLVGVLDGEGRASPRLRLPSEPAEHPLSRDDPNILWIGWRLDVHFGPPTDPGPAERDEGAVVLLDPSLVRVQEGRPDLETH